MPKDRSARSASYEARSRASPYTASPQKPPAVKDTKEWDEIRCPVCMEHPHNAVLLLCTSSNKGCRPFMCDTSYRHSNCLDQYRKSSKVSAPSQETEADQKVLPKLSCPLCRGTVTGWTVVEPARRYMNSKLRCCSKESCGFSGAYGDLRKHARTAHPSVRPTEADPDREIEWRRMEQQRDLGDFLSTIRSAIGGDGDVNEIMDGGGDNSSTTVLLILRIHRASSSSGIGVMSLRYPSGRRGSAAVSATVSGPEAAVIINSNDDDDNGVVDSGGLDGTMQLNEETDSSDKEDDDVEIL